MQEYDASFGGSRGCPCFGEELMPVGHGESTFFGGEVGHVE